MKREEITETLKLTIKK